MYQGPVVSRRGFPRGTPLSCTQWPPKVRKGPMGYMNSLACLPVPSLCRPYSHKLLTINNYVNCPSSFALARLNYLFHLPILRKSLCKYGSLQFVYKCLMRAKPFAFAQLALVGKFIDTSVLAST